MENINEHDSTNSNTSTFDIETPFQHFVLEEPRYVQNLNTYTTNPDQNDYNPSSFVHHPQPHPMPYLPQSHYNPSIQSSYCYPPNYHFNPSSFPTQPYINAPGSGIVIGASNAPLVHFPNDVRSYEQPWDVTQNMLSMPPMDMSESLERKMNAKAARLNRKMARQMSRQSQKNASKSGSSSNSSTSSSKSLRKLAKQSTSGNNKNVDEDLFTFCTQDNKKLRVLLVKVLTSSDVAAPGRIILPKREAEENLPAFGESLGIYMVMKKVNSDQEWRMRYRFWANHNDRMYILDQFGNFVSDNNMECGDSLILFQDKKKNFYFSITKAKPKKVTTKEEGSSEQSYMYNAYIATPFPAEAIAEEDSNLEILTEQLKHKENYDDNNLKTLYGN